MPRTSKNKFEIINDEIHISKEGWPLIGLTTYREDYYEELTSKTWTLTKANSETNDKGYLSNKTLGLLHRYIVAKWYGQDVLDTMTQKGFVVDHLNNNHTDCRISNLEFLKKAYNTAKGQAFDVDSKMMEHHIAVIKEIDRVNREVEHIRETELLNKMGFPENWKNITRYHLK